MDGVEDRGHLDAVSERAEDREPAALSVEQVLQTLSPLYRTKNDDELCS
jgi:hypothetical protein